ncbi:MAG TPA: type IV pilus biogenesis/stability protein PilW [Gammaproteobacteria bacterium]|jgi:type IV pilus assembly protein PilF|nr:type IV pilus biogenesis/stability protein PilW [Arenicellales bacterium]MDP6551546.1 type IV pilus biogenesis/stability protein PilW [Arenicellales bacterium]MDP6790940.1 type IV pilus biogenesis/stability protein PilW [Arenicellales bacterium]MDP6918487.1 type IV pilus biogenesis/stability protein PilW [Arenicellales bacterium]HCX87982.1 type IV pilus biogenesis/stability protein PilW [Gammaproteobacteria bacterium]|tara:strand:+ start:300 stop:1082 length:783 start_codon:yes stop_codon:yes gene_type:complete
MWGVTLKMKRLGTLLLALTMAGCVPLWEDEPGWDASQRVELYTRLGLEYMAQNRLASALEAMNDALAIAPGDSTANHAMALLKLRLGESADAETHFRKALASDSGNVGARNDYGSYLCGKGNWADGVYQLKSARDDPFNTEPYVSQYGLGVCLMGAGDLAGARDQFRAVLVVQPDNTTVLYQSAVVSYRLGEYLSARAFLERMFGAGGESADSLLLAVRTERKLGADDLAAEYAAKLRGSYPGSEQIRQLDVLMSNTGNG